MTIVKKLKRGDRTAFNELYKLHYSSLLAYAELFLTTDEAKDVVQDVFMNVWLKKERLDETLSIGGYLLRSVYNSALNVIKKRNHSKDYQHSIEERLEAVKYQYYDPDSNEIIHTLYAQELGKEINRAIDDLPDRCKEVFIMSYMEDLPSKEISKQLDLSVSTVDNHIYSALKQLRKKLKKYKGK